MPHPFRQLSTRLPNMLERTDMNMPVKTIMPKIATRVAYHGLMDSDNEPGSNIKKNVSNNMPCNPSPFDVSQADGQKAPIKRIVPPIITTATTNHRICPQTDEEKELVVWVTDELNTGENVNFTTYPGLKGYVLSMEVAQEINGENIILIQIARSVTADKKVKASSFLRPSDAQPLDEAPEDVKNGLKQMLGLSAE